MDHCNYLAFMRNRLYLDISEWFMLYGTSNKVQNVRYNKHIGVPEWCSAPTALRMAERP